MEKAKFISATYEKSSIHTHQGDRKSMQRFLDNGYKIKQRRSEYYVLVKSARIIAEFQNSTGQIFQYNAKKDILNYYHKSKISEDLFEKFYNEATNGDIIFYLDKGVIKFSKS